jgi:hypothetical protein
MRSILPFLCILLVISCKSDYNNISKLVINDKNCFELPGLNVVVFEDIYPEGHQGGGGIIQHNIRVATTIDQRKDLVIIHKPDGKPDILQQIEHGVLTILGGYENMGRVYRGIIAPTIPQYAMVGDVSYQTNVVYNPAVKNDGTLATTAGLKDDRKVFTEQNPAHEYSVVQGLASAARALHYYDQVLGADRVTEGK